MVVHTFAMMKILLIISAFIGFTLTEKLDRTYLPPPGSKFSGGIPGDLDVPLEFPRETKPTSHDKNLGRPEIAIGINRIGPNISPENNGDITSIVPSYGNAYGFPTTTTSYAFSQTTSYLPAAVSTIEPEVSINSRYPFNNSINNYDPSHVSFDHLRPNNPYNAVEEKIFSEEMLGGTNNVLKNQLPDNTIHSKEDKKVNDENVNSYNDDVNYIPETNPDFGDLSITSLPTAINHSLLDNYYDKYHVSSSPEPADERNLNFISSTPLPGNVYSKIPHQHVPTSTNIKNTSYSYPTLPERIQAQKDRDAVILTYENTITPDGYAYSFDTSNGIHADEKGTVINGVRAMGSYSYIGDDGKLYSVNYTADENGFRPYGAHLPTAPPIPDAILKVIEQAAKDKDNGIYDDGSYDENKYGFKKYNPTMNIKFLNPYNKGEKSKHFNKNISNKPLPHYSRYGDSINKDNNTNTENEQNFIVKNKKQSFTNNELFNEPASDIPSSDKYNRLDNIGKGHIGDSNNDYNYQLQDKGLKSVPPLDDISKKDKLTSIELYDETGYHYLKPQTDYTFKATDKLLNRFSETPSSNEIPAMNKIVKDTPVRPFMTPYVSRNEDIFVEHDGDDQSLDIPGKNHKKGNVILSHQNTNLHPTLTEPKTMPGKSGNGVVHNSINQFKQPEKSYNDQGYFYSKKVTSNGDSYIPYMPSAEITSDMTSTIPTAFPSRFNTKEFSQENNSQNPLTHQDSSLFHGQAATPDRPLAQEKYQVALNKLDNYGNNYNDDFTDPRSYNVPNMYGTDKDYIIEHSTSKNYNGEDFSGPKQKQTYNPLTGYHY